LTQADEQANIRRFETRGKPMQRIMKKSKIHTATVTGLELYYEGSITIDRDLLDMADILPGEQVQVVNLNNGNRLITYTISGKRGTGTIELNGPAARTAAIGDRVIIISYGNYDDAEAKAHEPIVVFVDENNRARNPAEQG
jgi:aspartate 1-decarboxylase